MTGSADTTQQDHHPFWLGGFAAMLATVITHPIDQTKIRLQTQARQQRRQPGIVSSSSRPGMLQTARQSVTSSANAHHRLPILALWQGLSASLLRQATYGTARFGVYAWLKDRRQRRRRRPPQAADLGGRGSWIGSIGDGLIAGMIAGLVGSPAELVLVRMCSDAVKPTLQERYRYRNALEGVWRIISKDGVGATWRGWQLTCGRSMLVNASQLSSYDAAKQALLANTRGWGLRDGPLVHTLSSTIASTIATTVCTPVDVIKSRYQSASAQVSPASSSSSSSSAIRNVLRMSIAQEGPRVLMRGWLPAWLRMTPTMTLTFVIMEQLKKVF